MRRLKYIILAALLVVIITCLGALGWLLGTTDGARLLLENISSRTSLTITAEKVEGRLWDELRLEGVNLQLPDLSIVIGAARLRWRPVFLPLARVSVRELMLSDVRISDSSPVSAEPPSLVWPKVSGVPAWLKVRVRKLQLKGLEYRRLDKEPVVVEEMSCRVVWRNRFLNIWDLAAATPDVSLSGAILAGFRSPSLLLKLYVSPKSPYAGFDSFFVYSKLYPAGGTEQVSGPVRIIGFADKRQRLRVTGEFGLSGDAVNVRQLQLVQPDRRGMVSGEGTLAMRRGGPSGQFRIALDNVDLSPELPDVQALSGTLTCAGTLQKYEGRFALTNKGKDWRTVRLSGTGRGDERGIRLTDLDGLLLDGKITGSAEMGWQDGISFAGALRGRNLNPSRMSPDWQGLVNLDVTGSVAWSETVPLRAEVKGRLLESRLHGNALTGEVEGRWQEENLLINRLILRGKGFDINAAGELREKITVNVQIADLSALVPETRGRLGLEGWLRWKDNRLSGSLSGEGRGLSAEGVEVGSADLVAGLSDAPGSPLQFDADLRGLAYGGLSADIAKLKASGSVERHAITAELHETGLELLATVNGTYGKGIWRGELVRFQGHDRTGPWHLQSPAVLRLADGVWTLSRLTLVGVRQELLELEGQINPKSLQGSLRTKWQALNLARIAPLPDKTHITGLSSGTLQAELRGRDRLSLTGQMEASGVVTANDHRIALQKSVLTMNWNERGMDTRLDLRLTEGGTLQARFFSPQPGRLAVPTQGNIDANWQGFDVAILKSWLPNGLDATGSLAGRVEAKLLPGGRYDFTGNSRLTNGTVRWVKDESRLTAVVRTADVSWGWRGGKGAAVAGGNGAAPWQTDHFTVKGLVEASATVASDGHRITIQHSSLGLDWHDRGMNTIFDVRLAEGGTLKGRFTSARAARLAIPSQGDIEASWQGLDIALLHPWLPTGFDVEGRLSGRVDGRLLPGGRIDLTGESGLSQGSVKWVNEGSQFTAAVRSAEIDWTWREDALAGNVSVALAEYGGAAGSFRLPLAARLPAAMDSRGQVAINVTGKMKETGLLHRLFPGLMQESHGELDVALQVGGSWEKPETGGHLRLTDAGAYLPGAGIQLKDVVLTARLAGDRIIIDSFQLNSGPGSLQGKAVITLKGWQVAGYQGNITGEKFRVVYLPELQVLANPDLSFSGNGEKLTVRGDIVVPELLVLAQPAGAAVQPSSDVVMEGAPRRVEKTAAMAMDVQVRVVLGDKVLVKSHGIDAQLKGSVTLMFENLDDIRSVGQIRVVKGSYKTYGVDLDITRGRVYYAGGTINQPTLDVLAIRQVGDVKAGVTVSGTPANLAVNLYSEPSMPDVDILSYVVLGHPTAYSGEQASLMARAAGALLSSSQARVVQDQLKNRLGLDVLEVKPVTEQTTGYKPIAVTPPGVTPTAAAGSTLAQTMVTIGKYLTPELYISYGRSLFTDANIFRLRYTFSRSWEVETQTGAESGADIFYKINFK